MLTLLVVFGWLEFLVGKDSELADESAWMYSVDESRM